MTQVSVSGSGTLAWSGDFYKARCGFCGNAVVGSAATEQEAMRLAEEHAAQVHGHTVIDWGPRKYAGQGPT